MKVKAKRDVEILMEDGRFSDFREGKIYRCEKLHGGFVLIDEQRNGFYCDAESLEEDFEIVVDCSPLFWLIANKIVTANINANKRTIIFVCKCKEII